MNPQNALIPALDVARDLLLGVKLIQADEARGVAELKRQGIQARKDGRPGFLRQAVYGEDGQVLFLQSVFQARDQAADQVATAQHGVQIHGGGRDAHRLQDAGNAGLQVGQQVRVQKRTV